MEEFIYIPNNNSNNNKNNNRKDNNNHTLAFYHASLAKDFDFSLPSFFEIQNELNAQLEFFYMVHTNQHCLDPFTKK